MSWSEGHHIIEHTQLRPLRSSDDIKTWWDQTEKLMVRNDLVAGHANMRACRLWRITLIHLLNYYEKMACINMLINDEDEYCKFFFSEKDHKQVARFRSSRRTLACSCPIKIIGVHERIIEWPFCFMSKEKMLFNTTVFASYNVCIILYFVYIHTWYRR
jgi:hypothetical protein